MAGTTIDEDNVVYKTLQKSVENQGIPCTLEEALSIGGGKEKQQAIIDIMIALGVDPAEAAILSKRAFAWFKAKLTESYQKLEVRPCPGAAEVFFAASQAWYPSGTEYRVQSRNCPVFAR